MARLADDVLLELAGSAVFARGQAYAARGKVQEPELSFPEHGLEAALLAKVLGTQPYNVGVMLKAGGEVDGACDCPHAEEGYFCKHQVAVALHLREHLHGDLNFADPRTHPQSSTPMAGGGLLRHAEPKQALRAFLQTQDATHLAAKLWQWAETNRELMADLKVWAAVSSANAADGKSLARLVSDLMSRPVSGFLDWRESGAYAQRAAGVLTVIEPLIAAQPSLALELCERALSALFKVTDEADDSNGEIGSLAMDLQALLIRAVEAAKPPTAWLGRWFTLMNADPWGQWDEAGVLDAAGPEFEARYFERAKKEWQRHAARVKPGAVHLDLSRFQARRRYLLGLKHQGDVQEVIQFMLASAEGASHFHELITYCESVSKPREALAYAQRAFALFPADQSIEACLLRCFERDGWDQEVLQIRRRQLERHPDPRAFHAAMAVAQRCGLDVACYRAELFAWAESRELQPARSVVGSVSRGEPALMVRDVSVRVSWLLSLGEFEQALDLLLPDHRCRDELLLMLARALPAAQDAAASALLQRLVIHEMRTSKSPYTRALALVREALTRMSRPQAQDWLSYLRLEFRPKKNFVSGLPAP